MRDTELLMAELPTPRRTKRKGPTINDLVQPRQRRHQSDHNETPRDWAQPNPNLYAPELGPRRKEIGVQTETEVTLGGGYDDGQSGAPLGEGGGVRQDLRRLLADSRREWGASYRTILAGMLDEEGNF